MHFQFSMISQINDAVKLCKPDIFTFQQYPLYGMCTQLYKSKNVMEGQDALTKLVLGAKDVDYCVLTAIVAWLGIDFLSN